MIQISCNNVKKYYGAELVLQSVSFEAKEGERIAIVGKNGCGKSTLLHLITGKEGVDEGAIAIRKGAKIGYLEQIPKYEETMSALDVLEIAFAMQRNLREQMTSLEEQMAKEEGEQLERVITRYGQLTQQYESLGGYEVEERKNRICTGLKLTESFLQKRFSTLSGGEKTLVLLAKILLQNPDVLVLDEPTNHLDIVMLDWLEQYLKNYEGTVLIVSHDRYFLDQVVTKVIEIADGKAKEYIGNYSAYVKEKEAYEANLNAAYQVQQKQLKQMERAIKQMRDWAARADSEKMFRRAAAMQKRMDRIERVEKPKGEEKPLNLEFGALVRSGKDVLRFQDVCMSYGDKILMKDLSFDVYYQEHVALIGRNGCGKTTLLRLVLGEEQPISGVVKIGESLKIGYLPQQIAFDHEDYSVLETIRDAMVISEGDARKLLARYKFYQDTVFKKVKNLSGGEKSRLKLAILMQQEVNFLILDEPTNHLDIASRERLEEALLSFQGTILLVSHDRYFINRIATRISEMEDFSICNYYGDYAYYKEKKEEKSQRNSVTVSKTQEEYKNQKIQKTKENQKTQDESRGKGSSSAENWKANQRRNSLTTGNQYKKNHLEEIIQELEAKIAKIEKEQVEAQSDYVHLMKVEQVLKEENEKLEQAMSEWMECE